MTADIAVNFGLSCELAFTPPTSQAMDPSSVPAMERQMLHRADMFDATASLSFPCIPAPGTSADRRHPRHPFGRWCEIDIDGECFPALAVDLSVSGMRLRNVVLAAGESVVVDVVLPQPLGESQHVSLRATVAWASDWEAGVIFHLSSEQAAAVYAAAVELS